ncbi:hypothetical protein R1sor_019184 [Riccia sorocarpa]|uniref:Uncharacterized protein n=1 Tax=Riccia sorocarpa TaxID=122646 RepID=A0ABD3IBY8_9MARC
MGKSPLETAPPSIITVVKRCPSQLQLDTIHEEGSYVKFEPVELTASFSNLGLDCKESKGDRRERSRAPWAILPYRRVVHSEYLELAVSSEELDYFLDIVADNRDLRVCSHLVELRNI